MTEQIEPTLGEILPKKDKLHEATAQYAIAINTLGGYTNWAPDDVDKLEITSLDKFSKVVSDCRFYYERDPIASTVLNKLVEIGITDFTIDQGQLSDNEYRVFLGIRDEIRKYIESCALEYLISGIVIPEINYESVPKEALQQMGVKKYNSLIIPNSMWVRDPTTVKINSVAFFDKPSYFIVLPDDLIYFIRNKGMYPDGNRDLALYEYVVRYYPEFVALVESGLKEIPYYNSLIVRRKVTTKSPYPIPYLFPALEALKHKRNLRRMDYSIASRVITAILLVKLGNDEYPVLEDGDDQFKAMQDQMAWRNTGGKDLEKIFQMFVNHTVEMEWIYPPVDALLNEKKYAEVNQDIFFALGFPRILTTGETERTQSSDPEMAMISPTKTMEKMQRDLLSIIKSIFYEVSTRNKFKDVPEVRFDKVNLHSVDKFLAVLTSLYEGGNISRETLDAEFGYTWSEEVDKRAAEEKKMEELGVPAFSPKPFSPQPETPGQPNNGNKTGMPAKKPAKTTQKEPKPA